MLSALLTGVTPAEASRAEPPRPASLNPVVPSGLNQLVARLTDPDPARRPPDLEEVAELLSRWAAPDLTPTVPLRPTSRAGRPRSPGRRLLPAGVLTALVLGLLVLAGLRLTQLLQPSAGPAGEAAQAAQVTAPVAVPAVVRLPGDRAATRRAKTGLRPETRQTHGPFPAGLVVAQEPPAATEVAPGTTVTPTVSAGPPSAPADHRREPERAPGRKRGRDG